MRLDRFRPTRALPQPVDWEGFWCKVDAQQDVEMQTVLGPQTIDLAEGWNLIGNCMSTAATLDLPSGVVALVYDPDTGYDIDDHPAARSGRLGEGDGRAAGDPYSFGRMSPSRG